MVACHQGVANLDFDSGSRWVCFEGVAKQRTEQSLLLYVIESKEPIVNKGTSENTEGPNPDASWRLECDTSSQ